MEYPVLDAGATGARIKGRFRGWFKYIFLISYGKIGGESHRKN